MSKATFLFALLLAATATGAQAQAVTWLSGRTLGPAGREMLARLAAGGGDGLDPARYDVARLDSLAGMLAAGADSAAAAELDRGLTAATVRFLLDLRQGRAPEWPVSTAGFRPERWDAGDALARAMAADSVPALVAASRPPFRQYSRLEQALASYRALGALEAPDLPRGPVRPGAPLGSAAALSRFLVALGDLAQPAAAPGDTIYNDALATGIRHFQARHALLPDGVIGAATAAALRVPIAARIRQLAFAMERLRWLPRITGQRLVVVNVPAFALFAFDSVGGSGDPALELRVIVGGAAGRRTPQLLERIRFVEFHPYWNVPSSILRHELLPRIRRDPGYLRANHLEIVGAGDRVLGDVATPALVAGLAAGQGRVRQRPGDDNALGPVKLTFPNTRGIYLHGTSAPQLFAESRRDLSHGCIRVEDPAGLAAWVLRDERGWSRDEVEQAMAPGPTRRVAVTGAPAVFIYYTTAIVRGDGTVYFYPDLYGRDRALAADPRLRLPEPR